MNDEQAVSGRRLRSVWWQRRDWSGGRAGIRQGRQRCRDLLEVCESQQQFSDTCASKDDTPTFGGVHGEEVTKNLARITERFHKLMGNISSLKYDILDVKATRWHDDYNIFKNGVKDLEVMMQNVITSAFETVVTVDQGLQMLAAPTRSAGQRMPAVRAPKLGEHTGGLLGKG